MSRVEITLDEDIIDVILGLVGRRPPHVKSCLKSGVTVRSYDFPGPNLNRWVVTDDGENLDYFIFFPHGRRADEEFTEWLKENRPEIFL